MKKVFIVVEDAYAPHALRQLLRRYGIDLPRSSIAHLEICSKKMERVVKAHAGLGSKVVVIADAEHESALEKENWIREKHGLGPGIHVLVVDPCMEALACQALGLKGCREKPCSAGPLEAVKEYWRRRHRVDYAKRFLPRLLLEADERGRLREVPEVRRLLGLLGDP